MSRALSFANENEIVERLKTVDWKERIDEIHHGSARPDLGVLTAVYSSVGSSTFRAFRASRNRRPSDLFRSCVSKELFVDGFAEFCRVNTNEAYRDWAFHLARQLVRCWGKELDSKLEFTRAMKLVNLLAKALCTVSPAWPTLSHKIAPSIDVALDQYSLRPLACVEGFGRLRNASMGDIKDKDEYERIQNKIAELCKRAGKPPVAYDFLMWDTTHSERN